MKKLKIITIISILMLTLVGCGNNVVSKAIEQGKLAMANQEYDKALASFQLAIDEGSKDKDIIVMSEIIEKYHTVKKEFEAGNIKEAKVIIDGIDKSYIDYSIKNEIDDLKKEIDAQVQLLEEINSNIEKLKNLYVDKKYDEAKNLIQELEENQLSEENEKIVNDIKDNIEKEIAKNEENKKEQQKKEQQKKEEQKQQFTSSKAISYVINAYGPAEESHGYSAPFGMKNDGRNYYQVFYEWRGASIPTVYYEYQVYEDGEIIVVLDNVN